VVCWKQNQWDLFRNFEREDMRVSADLMTEHKKTHRIPPFLVRLWLKIVYFPKAMVDQLIITFPTFQWPWRPGVTWVWVKVDQHQEMNGHWRKKQVQSFVALRDNVSRDFMGKTPMGFP